MMVATTRVETAPKPAPVKARSYTVEQVRRFVAARPECLDTLSERHRTLWLARTPVDGTTGMSLADIGKAYGGIGRERVRQLIEDANSAIIRFMRGDLRKCSHCAGQGWI